MCGQYCMYSLSKSIEKRPMDKILSVFNEDNRLENDRFVLEYTHNIFSC